MNGHSHQGLLVQLFSMNLTSVCVDQIFSLLNHVTNNSMHAVHSCFLTGDVIYLFFCTANDKMTFFFLLEL